MDQSWVEDERQYPESLQVPGDPVARSSRNGSSNRAQSTAIHPSSHSSQSTSRRHRASHQITSSTHNSNQEALSSQPAFDIKQHPAALSYTAAHPNRTIPKFGPYLLLQTLGEGEFGKVKLGLHNQWGEEVAVKLIRRGSVDSSVRMSKIEREIEVLRSLNHPNIVHLYDVIETDKYIGIILEYASGGELFDHILAHRYLKERDACKLFAQLISAVWYLHQKKIVHRDLKLENLLLDRNRNVIVTDFGFANRFEHKTDDLMQTSCGSPCYAAPELVISEGLYVGSAVDIWSCGVILYAMLAGYLPFDDDPANPEGDNINLLYKYILSTQLTFPDYVSNEARDLLSKMLVPDPQYRADLQTVMSHEWLSPYANLFGRSIEEYESVAHEQQMQKRANYQRQIREREREIQRALKTQQREQQRQHAYTEPRPPKPTGGYAGQLPMEVEDPDMFIATIPASSRRAVASAIIMPTSTEPMEDLVMTGPAIVEPQRNGDERARKESRASERRSGKGKEVDYREKKGAGSSSKGGRPPPGGFRHTIQLEYDDGGEHAEAMPPTPSRATGKRRHDEEDIVMQSAESPSRSRRESSGPRVSQTATPVPPMPSPPPMRVPKPQASHPPTNTAGFLTSPMLVRNAVTEPVIPTYKPANESPTSLPTPPAEIVVNTDVPIPATTTPLQSPVADSPMASTSSTPSSKPSKHGRGMSIDRFNISKLLHGKDSSGEEKKEREESKKRPSRKGSETSSNAGAGMAGIGAGGGIPTPPTSAALTSKSNLSVSSGGGTAATTASTLDQTSVGKGSSKRRGGKALSLVVDPITRMKESRSKTRASVAVGSEREKPLKTPLSANPTSSQIHLTAPPVKPEITAAPNTPSWRLPAMFNYSPAPPKTPTATTTDPVKGGMVTSTGASSKSQGVMDWFRKKSLAKQERRRTDGGNGRAEGTKTPTPEDPQVERGDAKTPTVSSFREAQAARSGAPAPAVVVTAENGSVHSGGSQGSAGSRKRDKVIEAIRTVAMPTASVLMPVSSSSTRPAPAAYNKIALRLHDGPVDPSTLFSAPPAEIVAHVLGILRAMGIESVKESEFKYRCIRPKRKKSGMVVREASGSSNGITAFNSVGTAASNGVDKRGLPVAPSSFTSAGMFKIFSRRTASQPSTATISPSLSFEHDDEVGTPKTTSTSLEPTTPSSQTQQIVEPIYGPPNDQGDEVRFSVEVTRIDRLDDLLSLDIRRLKGQLKSYKFLYDTIRERCNLPR